MGILRNDGVRKFKSVRNCIKIGSGAQTGIIRTLSSRGSYFSLQGITLVFKSPRQQEKKPYYLIGSKAFSCLFLPKIYNSPNKIYL